VERASKREIQWVAALKRRKEREKYGVFVVEGRKMVDELLRTPLQLRLLLSSSALPENFVPAAGTVIASELHKTVEERDFARISNLVQPEGVLAVFEIPHSEPRWTAQTWVVADRINDPGNLGALMRSAEWFGVGAFICTPETVDRYHPKVVQASKGSVGRLHSFEADWDTIYRAAQEQGVQLVTLDMAGVALERVEVPAACGIILGNETHGIAPFWKEHRLPSWSISRFTEGIDSLNVAMAGTIAMHWVATHRS